MREDIVDGIDEAHVEHFVGFIEHHGVHVFQIHYSAVYQVDEASGGGHDNLYAFAQRAYLAFDARAAVHRQDLDVGHIFGEVGEIAGYLEAQLACRGKHKGLRHATVEVDSLYQRQTEGCCLAGAGLCEGHKVVVAAEKHRYHLLLYWHRGLKPHIGYALQEVGTYA